jgi:hypothetical protein
MFLRAMPKPKEVTIRMTRPDSRILRKIIRSMQRAMKPVEMADRRTAVKMLRPRLTLNMNAK